MKRSDLLKMKKEEEDARQANIGKKIAKYQHSLSSEDSERIIANSERANVIANEALSIAKEANRIAFRQARWAMYAAVIAVIAAMIATKDEILKFIFWVLS